jgi:rubrerythrin
MEKSTVMGRNRTGTDMSPIDTKEMLAFSNATPPSSDGDARDMYDVRCGYAADAGVLGSIPPPGSLKGAASTTMKKLTGKNPEAFIDKLGCRLAFERAGVRLYDALIAKVSCAPGAGSIPVDTLWQFRNEEQKHFKMVEEAIRSIGADPTVQTPSADADGVAAMGLMQVLTSPRTSVSHCLEAILIAELADNDAWQLLIQLATKMGMEDMARDFTTALQEEDVHLTHIRQWFKESVLDDAAVA